MIGTCPYALVTQKGTPYQTFADVVSAAKKAPDTLNYATTGVGSLAHIASVLLQKQGGFSLTHVPYRGGGPALQDVLAGNVPLFMSNIVILLPHLRSGVLRALGVTSASPSRFVPGVEPFSRQGFPGSIRDSRAHRGQNAKCRGRYPQGPADSGTDRRTGG